MTGIYHHQQSASQHPPPLLPPISIENPNFPKTEEVRTIFITGLPEDVKDRELQNFLRWIPGYEASQVNFKGDQPMGFALFSNAEFAISARDALQDMAFDSESKCFLNAEIAKKNICIKSGDGIDVYQVEEFQAQEAQNDLGNTSSTPPAGKKKVAVIRGKGFSVSDDERLCKCWLNILQDPSVDNPQKENHFYDRVRDLFNQGLEHSKQRSTSSLQSRWGVINRAVRKFCGCLSDVENRSQNELTLLEKYEEAMRLYSRSEDNRNKAFTFERCLKILNGSPKWHEYNDAFSASSTPIFDLTPEGAKTKEKHLDICKELESYGKTTLNDAGFEATSSQRTEVTESAKEMDGHKEEQCDPQEIGMQHHRSKRQREMDRRDIASERAQNNSLVAKQLEIITMLMEMQKNAEQERLRMDDERVLAMPLDNMNDFERQYYESRKREIIARRCGGNQAP